MNKDQSVPEWLTGLLLLFLRDELAEEVLGDLQEKYHRDLNSGNRLRAQLNCLYQVIDYIRPFAMKRISSMNIGSLHIYGNYYKTGWRNLIRNKSYAFINIGGLALANNQYFENYASIAKVYRSEVRDGELMTSTAHVTGLGTLLKNESPSLFKDVVMVRARVGALMSSEFIILVAMSCVIAVPVVYVFMNRWLDQYAYHTSPGAGLFLIIIAGAFVLTMATVSVHALKAALGNPASTLKNE